MKPCYFNEFDPFAAAWLRELIREGLLPAGEVDERDIKEVEAKDLAGRKRVHLFGGIGGWELALQLAGFPEEREIWTGSCPCPPFSVAGIKKRCPKCSGKSLVPCPRRTGFFICAGCEHAWHADERHLWPEMWRLIRDSRPATIFGEQVAGADGLLWFSGVRASLELLGYAVGCADLAAASAGAPHIRQRLFWVAVAKGSRTVASLAEEQEHRGRERESGRVRSGMARVLADTDGGQPRNGSIQPSGQHGQQSEDNGTARGVEHPASNGRQQGRPKSDGSDADATCASLGRLPDAQSEGRSRVVSECEPYKRERSRIGSSGATDGMGHTDGEQERGSTSADAQGTTGWRAAELGDDGRDFWSDSTAICCRDDKHRRIPTEPTLFPLAHGIPNRVGMLRGAGNAILPQVAAAFITAFLESEGEVDMAKTKTAPKPSPKTRAAKAKPAAKPPRAPASASEVRAPVLAPSTGIPATTGGETWANIALDLIRPCAFNVRKHFAEDDIAGLGESIRAERLKEPLLVRPVGLTEAPVWSDKTREWVDCDHFETVDGERRLRAIRWIREAYPDEAHVYALVPVIVRPMTDEQVRATMLLSREQSRDLSVSELVAGYTSLRATQADDTAVTKLVGKSIGYVRGVLRLARLPAWALAAVDAGTLPRATAELVARVPGEESRKRCAACVLTNCLDPSHLRPNWLPDVEFPPQPGDESMSFRDTKELIRNHFQVELKRAPFDRKSLELLPEAGSCEACPKRAGNDEEAKAEGVRADVCLDPDCYREKVQAHDKAQLQKGIDAGAEIAPEDFVWTGGESAPRGWCDVESPADQTELVSVAFTNNRRRGETLFTLLGLFRSKGAIKHPDESISVFAVLDTKHKLRFIAKTSHVQKKLQTVGVLKKPEPRAKSDAKPATATPSANGKHAKVPAGPSSYELDHTAAEIAAKVLCEYTAEQCSELDEYDDAHEDGPIRLALQLALRTLYFDALVNGGFRVGDFVKEKFGDPISAGKGEAMDAAIAALKPSQMVGALIELGARMELEQGPNRPTANELLEFAELDWQALQEHARRVLTGGETAEEKIAKAEAKPVAAPPAKTAEPTAAPADIPLAAVPNFPPEALAQLALHGVATVEQVYAEVEKLKKLPGKHGATIYTAMLEAGVSRDEYLDAVDAIDAASKKGETK